MGVVGIAVDSDENADVAQDAQHKQAQIGGPHLSLHQGGGGGVDAGLSPHHTGQMLQTGNQHGPQEVSHPKDQQIQQIGRQRIVK